MRIQVKQLFLKEIQDLLKEKGFRSHLTKEEDIRDMQNMQKSSYNQEDVLNKIKDEIIIVLQTSQEKRI